MITTSALPDYHLLRPNAVAIPFRIRSTSPKRSAAQIALLDMESPPRANLSSATRRYLASLGTVDPDGDAETAEVVWMHALAIGYSPAYFAENADGIRQDWPRIPFPATREELLRSADLGREVAALLDTEQAVSGVAVDPVRAELRPLALVSSASDRTLGAGDLSVTAGWGHAGKGGVTMPGKGRLVLRDYTADERTAIEAGAAESGIRPGDALGCLGDMTCDIYLNDDAYWRNVPVKVWGYTIGGYQVFKKWLSYRERSFLGRPLTPEEARYVTEIARRIAAIVLLQPRLDANYRAVTQDVYSWPR